MGQSALSKVHSTPKPSRSNLIERATSPDQKEPLKIEDGNKTPRSLGTLQLDHTNNVSFICHHCQDWLSEALEKAHMGHKTTQPKSFFVTEEDDEFNFTTSRKLSDIFKAHEFCWFCARFYIEAICGKGNDLIPDKPTATKFRKIKFHRARPETEIDIGLKSGGLGSFNGLRSLEIMFGSVPVVSLWISNFANFPPEYSQLTYSFGPPSDPSVGNELTYNGTGTKYAFVERDSLSDDPQYLKHMPLPRIQKIFDWITECDSSHDCRQMLISLDRKETFWPTRLIEIVSADSVRLRETHLLPLPDGAKYATLSHRWANNYTDLLLSSNIKSYKSSIPFGKLNQVNRDAIRLCDVLNLKYLWIDSLCILQDSRVDWKKEAPLMYKVYGNSYLNIAAASHRSSEDGLFRRAMPFLINNVQIAVGENTFARQIPYHSLKDMKKLGVDQSELVQRGWVQQEVILSPRILFMSEGQIYWACRENQWAEFEVGSIDGYFTASHIYSPINFLPGYKPLSIEDFWNLETLGQAWIVILKSYVKTQVSFQEDRYHALAGVAALFRARYLQLGLQTRLIAGFWEHNLLRCLLWVSSTGKVSPEDSGLYLPTWSALRSDQPIEFWAVHDEEKLDRTVATVEQVDVQSKYLDLEFGPLSSAKLQLRAPTLHLELRPCSSFAKSPKCRHQTANTTGPESGVDTDPICFDTITLSGEEIGVLNVSDLMDLDYVRVRLDCSTTELASALKCVMLSVHYYHSFYLILREQSHLVDGKRVYERIGSMAIRLSYKTMDDLPEDDVEILSTLESTDEFSWEDLILV